MRSISRIFVAVLSLTLLIQAEAQGRRRAVRSGPPEATPQATTFERIDRAVAEGRITKDQATLYKVFSLYEDPRLPQELRGDDTGISDSVFLTEVAAQYATLPVEIQQQIAPFLIPPFHQNSWWELRRQQARSYATHDIVSYGIGPDKPCLDCPLALDWEFAPTANGKVKIWYHESDVQAEAKAKDFAFEIDHRIWPKLQSLMGREPLPDEGDGFWLGAQMGGDTRLDIALVDIDRSITTGIYDDACGGAAWAYIQFNKSKPREELAHEVMHAFQYAFNVKVRGADCTGEAEYRWLRESTAEWVKDSIYPSSTSPDNEHGFAPYYLGDPEASLNQRHDKHWYGAYLFPFFLARLKGQTDVVGRIWANTESMPSLAAIEQELQPLGGFEKVWPEFALRNWNDGPVDDYRKIDKLETRPLEHGDTFLKGGAVDKYAPLNVELPHLSASYKHFVLNDNVRSFAFLNGLTYKLSTTPRLMHGAFDLGLQYQWDEVPADKKRGVSIQAIIKRNGKWEQPEDWTNVQYKPFCRQKPEEKIEEIVLIFANGNHDESSVLQAPALLPLLIATDMPCRWEGSLKRESNPQTMPIGPFKLEYSLTREPRESVEVKDFFLGYTYDTTGKAAWNSIGSSGPCTANVRNDHAPIRTDFQAFSMNFAPQNSTGYRKGWFPIALQEDAIIPMNCGPMGTMEMNAGIQTFPAADPLMLIGANPGGAMIGEATDLLGKWKWDFKPKL